MNNKIVLNLLHIGPKNEGIKTIMYAYLEPKHKKFATDSECFWSNIRDTTDCQKYSDYQYSKSLNNAHLFNASHVWELNYYNHNGNLILNDNYNNLHYIEIVIKNEQSNEKNVIESEKKRIKETMT